MQILYNFGEILYAYMREIEYFCTRDLKITAEQHNNLTI